MSSWFPSPSALPKRLARPSDLYGDAVASDVFVWEKLASAHVLRKGTHTAFSPKWGVSEDRKEIETCIREVVEFQMEEGMRLQGEPIPEPTVEAGNVSARLRNDGRLDPERHSLYRTVV